MSTRLVKPRTLFLQHEQRRFYWNEPGHQELYQPMVLSGLLGEVRTYPYQRDVRWLERERGFHEHMTLKHGRGEVVRPELHDWHDDGCIEGMIDEVIREFKPDLVVYALTWPNQAIPADVIASLKKRRGFKLFSVIWDYDENNPLLMNYDREIIEVSDMVSVADSYWRTERIKSQSGLYKDFSNVEVVHFMPTIPNPRLYFPRKEKLFDVAIAGSSEGQRVDIIEELTKRNIKVHRIGGLLLEDSYLSEHEYAKQIAQSKIVVNTQTQLERVQLKGRVSQVLSCGSFLLEQNNSESDNFLAGIDVDTWTTIDELIVKIEYWLNKEEERELKALSAHNKYVSRYNPVQWTEAILNF